MFVSPETMAFIIGLSASDAEKLELIRRLHADSATMTPVRSLGAERQRRYRQRKAVTGDVTSNVTGDARGDVTEPLSLSPSSPEPPSSTNPNQVPPLSPPTKPDRDDVLEAFDAWNDVARRCGLPIGKTLDPPRRKAIRARLAEAGLDGWSEALEGVERSAFLRGKVPGRDGRTMRADLSFVCQAKSFTRLREGFYGRDIAPAKPPRPLTAEPAVQASRVRHFRDTGEWKPTWGEKPDLESAA